MGTWRAHDSMYDDPRFRAVWEQGRCPVGLFFLGTLYSSRQGVPFVPESEVVKLVPNARQRQRLVETLLCVELWYEVPGGYSFDVGPGELVRGFIGEREAISPATRRAVLERDGMVCGICGDEIADRSDLHLDHITPVARGGRSTPNNLQPAHARCNIAKGARVD